MRENFCAAPWSSISLDPDGQAKNCCIAADRVSLQEFNQIQNIPKFIEIRQEFINDNQHSSCEGCWQRERDGDLHSRRSTYQYDDFYHNLESATDFQLEYLDLRWSNTCNLNCVYCGPVFSSKWAELKGQKQRFRIFPTVTDADLAKLKVLQLAGGEPLLIKENLDVLERLLKVNPEVKIEVTTNLTMIGNQIYKTLTKFDNVTWIVSFESTGNRFEYIRNGAKWSDFYNNLNTLSMDCLDIHVNMVYFPLSSFDIVNAINVALEFTTEENVFLVSQFGGHGFDMLGQDALQCINQHNLDQIDNLPKTLQKRLADQIRTSVTNRIKTELPLYDEFDQLTNQSHKSIFTELY